MRWLYSTLGGKLLRAPLKLVPKSLTVRILSGPNQGLLWKVQAGFDAHWLGIYERGKMHAFAEQLRPGDVVWDAGANVGYYTLLASRRVGSEGRVVAFEPVPENLGLLEEHLQRNALRNVTVVPKALGRIAGEARFSCGASGSQGRLADQGALTVSVIAGDEEIAAGRLPRPNVIKMDIEGGEIEALAGMPCALQHARAVFIATHGETARSVVEQLGGFQRLEEDEYARIIRA